MEVKPLTNENIDDFYNFMKNTGFEDCQCVFFYRAHLPGETWQLSVDEMKDIRKDITMNKCDGYLGYVNKEVVCWCQVISMDDSIFLKKIIECDNPEAVVLSCFLTHPEHRREGLMRIMIGEIIEILIRQGVKEIYGIPVNEAVFEKSDKKHHSVLGHTGYIGIYEEFGFKEVKITERYIVVRRV